MNKSISLDAMRYIILLPGPTLEADNFLFLIKRKIVSVFIESFSAASFGV